MSRKWRKGTACITLLGILIIAWNTSHFMTSLKSEGAADRHKAATTIEPDEQRREPVTPRAGLPSLRPPNSNEYRPETCPSLAPVNGGAKIPSVLLQELAALGHSRERGSIIVDKKWQEELLGNICEIQFVGENAFAVSTKATTKAFEALQWLRGEGILWNLTKGCRGSVAMTQPHSPGPAMPVSALSSTWSAAIKKLPQVRPQPLPATERSSFQKSTFGRIPKKASWLTATNMCASCEPPPGAYYMATRHSCYFTLWGIGDAARLHKLTSTSRGGRNVIFKERISSYQYGGILSPHKFEALVDDKGQSFTSSWLVNGTTVWLGPYEFDNPGHVIHDALWTWQLALMLPDIYAADPNQKKAGPPVYPSPIRGVFSHDFEELSSGYFGVLSWIIAQGEQQLQRDRNLGLNVERIERSPFPTLDIKRPLVCFEKLIIPGQDRHVDGGGLGLRKVVAKRLRQHVFGALEQLKRQSFGAASVMTGESPRRRKPRIFLYGRNDVYRRSIDNTDVLFDIAAEVAQRHQLPPPIIVRTFQISPEEQFELMTSIDVFVAIQGSHLQNSLFMPEDAAIVELAPCRAEFVSFMRRYGKYLESQSYTYVSLCDNVMINYSEKDAATQNVTLCPQVTARIKEAMEKAVAVVLRGRGLA